MGVEYTACNACEQSFYNQCVTSCECCWESVCVSCVINLPNEIHLRRGDIFDSQTKVLRGADGLLAEHCPFCSGDLVSIEQKLDWLLQRVNMTDDAVTKEILQLRLKSEGNIRISDEQVLTKEIAAQFEADEDSVDLREFATIEGAAAESLSKHKGDLCLSGLTSLSDAAAESLSKHAGGLLLGLTALSNSVAESLSKHEGGLFLDGLTSLSDAAAASLSKHEGELLLSGLTSLSDAAAESLSNRIGEGSLSLGLTKLSDTAAESFRKHKGILHLDGLTSLTDVAAESLSKHGGELYLDLDELPESTAEILRSHPSYTENEDEHDDEPIVNSDALDNVTNLSAKILTLSEAEGFVAGTVLFLGTYTTIEDDAAQYLANSGKNKLIINDLQSLTDASAAALSEYPGDLRLLGLKDISDTAAGHLAKHPNLNINLDNLPASAAQILRDAGHGK